MDNQGTTLVIQPGREYREVAQNFLAESKDGKEQAQNVSTPIFEGTRMYYRTPGHLYCIGDKLKKEKTGPAGHTPRPNPKK